MSFISPRTEDWGATLQGIHKEMLFVLSILQGIILRHLEEDGGYLPVWKALDPMPN